MKHLTFSLFTLTAATAALIVPTIRAEPAASQPAAASTYPLDTCFVSGDKLGAMGAPIVQTIDGREVRFCCSACVDEFKKDPAAAHQKLDETIVAKLKPTYPLKTCPVSDEPLGSMGEPVMYVDRKTNRLIELCCKSCLKTVKADASAALAKIDAASGK